LDPGLWSTLNETMRATTKTENEPALLWTNKSTRQIARDLTLNRHPISHEKVAQILRKQGFRLQGTRQAEENGGSQHRQEQFRRVNQLVEGLVAEGCPVLFVETRKKDNAWLCQERDKGECARGAEAQAPDWPDQLLAGEYPAGVFDVKLARDCVNVETAYNDIALVVDSILGWWELDGQKIFPMATHVAVITEISGAKTLAYWLKELKRLAAYTGLTVDFSRFPPGTSKWNMPARRLFSFTASHWQGSPVRDYETVTRLIGYHGEIRTMALGLRLDHSRYQSPTPENFDQAQNAFDTFWNFTLEPEFDQNAQEEESLAAAI
jgi:hypothetical protein